MKGSKILVIGYLLLTTVGQSVTTIDTNYGTKSTLILLKWKSSEILSDSEGKRLPYIKPFKLFPKIKMNYIEDRIFEIRQVDDNSFLVLGPQDEMRIFVQNKCTNIGKSMIRSFLK